MASARARRRAISSISWASGCKAGLTIVGVPTSERTAAQARDLGVPLASLEEHPELDLTIDGADEVDGALRLIKGGGGALLREKIVAAASKRMVVIADASKRSNGSALSLCPSKSRPSASPPRAAISRRPAPALGLSPRIELRRAKEGGGIFITDGGHHIFDCAFGELSAPEALASSLNAIPGVVEHGLFIKLASAAILAGAAGVEILGDLA